MTGKATWRKFSAEYKLRVLTQVEASTERKQIGALLRTVDWQTQVQVARHTHMPTC